MQESNDSPNLAEMLVQMQTRLDQQQAELERLRQQVASQALDSSASPTSPGIPSSPSRRRLLKHLALGTIGFGALSVGAALSGAGVVQAETVSDNAIEGAAGANGYGGKFTGGLAPLLLVPSTSNGAPSVSGHQKGELYSSKDGKLYFFNGTSWVNLTDSSGPSLTFLTTPDRFLDTRSFVQSGDTAGIIAAGTIRSFKLGGGTGQGSSTIPSTATAVIGNITAVPGAITGGGYLQLYPQGATRPAVATVNYSATSGPIGNSFNVTLNVTNGKVSIFAFKDAHAIIDIVGYYI